MRWQTRSHTYCMPKWQWQLTNLKEKHNSVAKFVHYHHSYKNKERFLKEKRKGKRSLYFYDYAITEASLI